MSIIILLAIGDLDDRNFAYLAVPRPLLRPRPGLFRGRAPLVPASIYQFCPMVMPQPNAVNGPNQEDRCWPLDGLPLWRADRRKARRHRSGMDVAISQSISPEEYADRAITPSESCSSRSENPTGEAGQPCSPTF
jgi:hypothetical protein